MSLDSHSLLISILFLISRLFHPVKRTKLKETPGIYSIDRVALDDPNSMMDQTSGLSTNEKLLSVGRMVNIFVLSFTRLSINLICFILHRLSMMKWIRRTATKRTSNLRLN